MGKSRRTASVVFSTFAATGLAAGLLGVPAASSTRAPAATRTTRIVCPTDSSGATAVPTPCCEPVVAQVTLPCCPVPTAAPQPICCPPNASGTAPLCCGAQCLSGVTIDARPDPAVAGDSVTIAGTVLGGGATKVTLWQKLAGQSAFSALASTTSSSSGAYSFRRDDVTSDLSWYVTAGSDQSVTISEPVDAVLALSAGRSRMRADTRVRMTGSVRPADSGGRVTVLGRPGHGSWRTLAHARLNAASRFSLRIRLRWAGHWQLMASFGGDASNRGGRSPMVAVTVTR